MNRRNPISHFLLRYRRLLPFGIVAAGVLLAAVIVLAPSGKQDGAAPTTMRSLAELQDCPADGQFDCYATYFEATTTEKDAKVALADLKQLYDQGDGYAKSQCHQLAHEIGHAGYAKYGTLAAAYTKGDAFCWSGYYHGVTEEAVGAMGAARIKEEANSICKDLAASKQYSFDHYNCVHGLGHGFMTVDDFNLFNALKTCDLLNDAWERSSCYGGVFMENVMVAVREDGVSEYLKPDQPLYPCTAVETAYKQQCYLMQTSYALQQNGYDFAKGFLLCRNTADPEYAATCYESLGRDASGSTVSDITQTKARCDTAPDEMGLEHCMLGAVRDFVSYHHSDAQAKAFCAVFTPRLQERCVAEVTMYYSTFR